MLVAVGTIMSEISSITEMVKWVGLGMLVLAVVGFGGALIAESHVDRRRAERRRAEGVVHPSPRARRMKALKDRKAALEKRLEYAGSDELVGRRQREQLTAERALVVAELAHMNAGREGVDTAKSETFAGLSETERMNARRRLKRRRERLLAELESGELKPGPSVRGQLFLIKDEIEALEELTLKTFPSSIASTSEGGALSPGEPDSESSPPRRRLEFDRIASDHDQLRSRWGKWHTDLGLLVEFPAIHDVQHEAFARRIIDAHDDANDARAKAEAGKEQSAAVTGFSAAVDEYAAALDDGEHKARLIARGPALDPVLNRIMTTAETLLTKIHAYQAGDSAVGWGECQTAANGLVKLLKSVIGHQADAIPELEAAIARELEPAKGVASQGQVTEVHDLGKEER